MRRKGDQSRLMSKKIILIVEDDEDIQEIYKDMLESSFDVDLKQSYNGKEGLSAVQEKTPDLVILDLLMPVMDGATFLKGLRNELNLKEVPVVICSVNQKLANELLSDKQAEAVLPKLFSQKDLIATITQLTDIEPKVSQS